MQPRRILPTKGHEGTRINAGRSAFSLLFIRVHSCPFVGNIFNLFVDTTGLRWPNIGMKYLNLGVMFVSVGMLAGCGHDTWSYRAVPDINISRPNELDSEGRLVLKLEPEGTVRQTPELQQWLHEHPEAAAKRTVLMASFQHDSEWYSYTHGRTLVIFLEGAPKLGQYWLNPDNAVLITYSAYSGPARERVALVGSVTIDQINGHDIVAKIACRDSTEIDTSLFLDQPWDPVNREEPFVLRGKFHFDITEPTDPVFEKSAVKWVNRNDAETVARRE
jgi:hypothetical protein